MVQQQLDLFIDEKKLQETQEKIQIQREDVKKFLPKHDPNKTREVVKVIKTHVDKVNYKFENWLDVCLAAVEGREDDYMHLIHDMPREKLNDYVTAYATLQDFFMNGYYDNVLGTFCQENYRIGNGYFITPFHISLMMAEMIGIKPEEKLHEPCCGSGSMLLAAKFVIHKNYGWIKSCFYINKMSGTDVGLIQVKMCKLQLKLSNYLYMISRIHDSIIECSKRC